MYYLHINKITFFSHWTIQRLAILLFLLFSCFTYLYSYLNIFIICIFFLSLHFSEGLFTIINDYIHDSYLNVYLTTFIRIFILFVLKSTFVLFI